MSVLRVTASETRLRGDPLDGISAGRQWIEKQIRPGINAGIQEQPWHNVFAYPKHVVGGQLYVKEGGLLIIMQGIFDGYTINLRRY
jgi:hypothetical protein